MTDTPPVNYAMLDTDIRAELWRRGRLEYKLDATQLELYRWLKRREHSVYVWEIARRIGKSFGLNVIACETAVLSPGARVNYAAPTVKAAREIVLPLMRLVTEDAPPDCAPVWHESRGHFVFPNGAHIALFGADDEAQADRGRGTDAVLNIVDEAAFTPVLGYLVNSVLIPQTMLTGGPTIIASTPPLSPSHDFCAIADAAESDGARQHRTIYQHGRMTRAQVDAYLTQQARARGLTLEQFMQTTDARREYLAERVLDEALAVCPEFKLVEADVVRDFERPAHFDLYVSLDPGLVRDANGGLFAITDFEHQRLLIEHELLLRGNTEMVDAALWDIVLAHYMQDDNTPIPPFMAVVDDPAGRTVVGRPKLVTDLWAQHRMQFQPAQKVDRAAADNLWRVEMGRKSIWIHPRCRKLIHQLKTALKNPRTGDFERDSEGHQDLLAALRYLVRAWDAGKAHNPWPIEQRDPAKVAWRAETPKPSILSMMRRR